MQKAAEYIIWGFLTIFYDIIIIHLVYMVKQMKSCYTEQVETDYNKFGDIFYREGYTWY